jgi:hypothetical protein
MTDAARETDYENTPSATKHAITPVMRYFDALRDL